MKWRIDISCELLEISEGECIPFGYGLAWHEPWKQIGVYCPMPFNWIARFMRWCHYKTKFPSPKFWEKERP